MLVRGISNTSIKRNSRLWPLICSYSAEHGLLYQFTWFKGVGESLDSKNCWTRILLLKHHMKIIKKPKLTECTLKNWECPKNIHFSHFSKSFLILFSRYVFFKKNKGTNVLRFSQSWNGFCTRFRFVIVMTMYEGRVTNMLVVRSHHAPNVDTRWKKQRICQCQVSASNSFYILRVQCRKLQAPF